MTEPWLTKRELASKLRVSTRTVERRIKPSLEVGSQNRYFLSDAEAQLQGVPEMGGNVIRFPRERTRGESGMKRDEIIERLQAEADHVAEGFTHYYRVQDPRVMAANGARQNAFEEAIRIVEGDESAGTAARRTRDAPTD